jgi:hypothetical protein
MSNYTIEEISNLFERYNACRMKSIRLGATESKIPRFVRIPMDEFEGIYESKNGDRILSAINEEINIMRLWSLYKVFDGEAKERERKEGGKGKGRLDLYFSDEDLFGEGL